MKLRRDEPHLPRTCRQIEKETRHLLDAFTTVILTDRRYGLAEDLKNALDSQGRTFTGVQQLQIDPERTDIFLLFSKLYMHERHLQHLREKCGKFHEIFTSLRRLILDTKYAQTQNYNLCAMRRLFAKPDLEIAYTEWPDVRP